MITWVTTRRAKQAIVRHLRSEWGKGLSPVTRVASYEGMWRKRESYPPSAYVLVDLEGLTASQKHQASALRIRLLAHGHAVLNDPLRWLPQFELLRSLYAAGRNEFNVHPGDNPDAPIRFPVQLHDRQEGHWMESRLLANAQQVRAAMLGRRLPRIGARDASGRRHWWRPGLRDSQLLLVEHCDTADASGIYRRYSALVVGDYILPRRLVVSRHWTCRQLVIRGEWAEHEEVDYVCSNPHAAILKQLFQLAGIQYGRIDYGLRQGRIQVWSAHTNPDLGSSDRLDAPPSTCRQRCAERLRAALERLGIGLDRLSRAA